MAVLEVFCRRVLLLDFGRDRLRIGLYFRVVGSIEMWLDLHTQPRDIYRAGAAVAFRCGL